MFNREFALRFFAIPIRLMLAELQKSLGRVDPVPPMYVRGFGVLPFGEIRKIHSRTQVRGVLWFGVDR